MNKCINCNFKFETQHSFCPSCGFDLRDNNDVDKKRIMDSHVPELGSAPEQIETKSSLNIYSSSVLTVFLWSVALSIVVLIFYSAKGRLDTEVIAQNIIYGLIARSFIALLFALIISSFAKNKQERFSKVGKFIMLLLSFNELGKIIALSGL